jgi:hypothetical protein
MIAYVSPTTIAQYKTLSAFVQEYLMRDGVAHEAELLHLQNQQPWKDKIYNAHSQYFQTQKAPQHDFHGNPMIDPQVWAPWVGIYDSILWNAYFSRADNDVEKQTMQQAMRDKYKMAVIDPDFFNGQTAPNP